MRVPSGVIFLPCADIRKTLSFYRDILHLEVVQKQSDSLYIFDTGYGYWGFCQYGDGRKLSGRICLSLNLESNEEVMAKYEELKDICDIVKAPAKHPDFPVYSFFIRDPDGYLVEYQNVAE